MLKGLERSLFFGFVLALLISASVNFGQADGFEIRNTVGSPDPDIELVVLDGGGVPLSGADVQVNGTVDLKTGATGTVVVVNATPTSPQTVKVVYLGVKVFEATLDPDPSIKREIRASVYDWILKVYDSQRRDLVEGAAISLSHTLSAQVSFTEKTDSEGKLQLNDLPAGDYRVTVSYWGKKVNETTLLLDSQSKTSEILSTLYRLSVRLLDVNSNPVPDVEVRIWNTTDTSKRYVSVKSNSSGVALFRTVTGDTDYLVEAWFKDERILTESVTLQRGDGEKVGLTGLLYLRMEVRDWKNQTVINDLRYSVTGELYREGAVYSSSKSTQGLLYFGHVPAGNFRVVLKVEEIVVLDQTESFGASRQNSTVMAKFYDVTLTVDSSELVNKSQVANLAIQLSFGSAFRLDRVLDSGGQLAVADLPPTTVNYVLFIRDRVVGRGSFKVEKDDDSRQLRVIAYSMLLYLQNGDGEDIASDFQIFLLDDTTIFRGSSDAGGRVLLAKLLPLSYEIRIRYRGVQTLSEQIDLTDDVVKTFLTRVFTITISLKDHDDETPVEGAEIIVRSAVLEANGTSNREGLAVFKNLPGSTTEAPTYEALAKLQGRVVGSTRTFSLTKSTVEPIPSARIFDLILGVLDGQGNPLEFGIATVNVDGVVVRNVTISKGVARLPDIPAGRLRLAVSLYGLEVASSDLDLEGDEQSVDFRARVHSLKTTALKDDGEPLVGARVSIIHSGRSIVSLEPSDSGDASFYLPEGSYEISVSYQETEVARQRFSLEASDKIVVRTAVFRIVINVLNLRGESVGPALLSVKSTGRDILPRMRSPIGQFSFHLAGGDYSITLSLADKTYVTSLKSRAGVTLNILHLIEKEDTQLFVMGAAGFPGLGVVMALAAKRKRKKPVGRPVEPKVKPGVPRI